LPYETHADIRTFGREFSVQRDRWIRTKIPRLICAAVLCGILVAGFARSDVRDQRELTATQVNRHYETWTTTGRPELSGNENAVAVYLFGERAGNIIHDAIQPGIDLNIPARATRSCIRYFSNRSGRSTNLDEVIGGMSQRT
jgi:hypothetical protein